MGCLRTRLVILSVLSVFITSVESNQGNGINYRLSQAQIYVNDGHIYLVPAEHRNLVLVANGTGKIVFNNVELNSLVGSIRNSTRDIRAVKRIIGTPSNSSLRITTRLSTIERSLNRLDTLTGLDSRLTTVERQIQVTNFSMTTGTGRTNINQRVRRLQNRVEALEATVNRATSPTGNPCGSNPCQNGGTCIPTVYGAFCWCQSGWEGNRCQQDVNECLYLAGTTSGCQNGATCINRQGSYECQCRSGFSGADCNTRSGGCSSASAWELCRHGICVDQHAGSRPFVCICDQGWKSDNINPACAVDVDECNSGQVSCSQNPPVPCINTPGSFACGPCPLGYSGNGHRCTDINECLFANGGCSTSPYVECINTPGSRTCGECPAGYMGNGMTCQYVGICQINNGGCHPLARCVQNPMIGQSYVQCICPAGMTGTGMGLHGCFPYQSPAGGGGTAIGPSIGPSDNPCTSNRCVNGLCHPMGASFTCVCFTGFTGITCAERVNPCVSSPCLNGGTCVSNSNSARGFTCTCPNSFTGDVCERQEESCGGTLSAETGILAYPSDQSQLTYSRNANCAWIFRVASGKVVTLTFSNFHLEGGSGCRHDWLQIHDGSDTTAPSIGKFCGNELPKNGTIVSTHNVLYMWFVSDISTTGLGFSLIWNTTDPVCGGFTTGLTHGSIYSPGYNGNAGRYPYNRDCLWQIEVSPGKRIQLVFATMRIETHPNCSYDYVEVRDGLEENAHVLQTFCNTTLPPPLVSSGRYLAIRFHSDDVETDLGFHVTFAEVPGVPGCGGLLSRNWGTLSSPHHPEPYGHEMECDWLIRIPNPNDRVILKFTTFELEDHTRCLYDYVEVRDGGSPTSDLVARFCGLNIPPDYTSKGNTLFIRFHSDHSVTRGGFAAKYETVCGGLFEQSNGILRSPNHPGVYPNNKDCVFIISQPMGKAIRLDFIEFDVESGMDSTCFFDYVEVRDGDTENSTLIGHYCGQQQAAPEPILSTFNYLWLRFKTDGNVQNRGFLANYTTFDVGCGGILRNSHGLLSSPGHPEVYPHGVTCTWIIRGVTGQVVRLSWIAFSLEGNRNCNYDRVEIFDNSTLLRNGSSMGRYCGSDLPPVFTSSDNTMTVFFRSDHSVAHDGFSANYVLLNSSLVCGGNFYSEQGVLRSPRFPNNYSNSKSCLWTITVPAGKQIMLNITDFDLENGTSSRCNYDYLEIRNGGHFSSPLIGRFCGNNLPPTNIPSFTNALYLKFSSDGSHTRKGFQIFWDGTATGCGGRLGGTSGSLASPGYPHSSGYRTECSWTIVVNQGSIIQLMFLDLDMQQSTGPCWGEHVEIRSGYTRNGKLIGKYCHSESPLSINSTENSLWIKYVSGYGTTGRGFLARYQTVCSRTLQGDFGGVIESPNWPKPYSHNRNCTWEILAPIGNTVNISFSHFSVEGPHLENCLYDYVEVSEYRKGGRNPQSLGKYCGDNRPSRLASKTDAVSVRFVSDSTLAMNGFRLEWKISGCGGKLIGDWGVLKSPNYPRRHNSSVECLWQITAELGSKVRLEIYDMDIEDSRGCIWDGLMVYGGANADSPLLSQMCTTFSYNSPSSTPKVIDSHGNNMFVKFYADPSVTRRGFHAYFHSVSGGCGGRISAPSGYVYSPNYPSNYDHNDDCRWLISVDGNHVVELEFTDFNVERHSNCSYDNLAVYDGRSEYDPQLLYHCGDTLPSPAKIKSTGNFMFIRLRTDDSSSAKGFKANYSTGCGARIKARYGYGYDTLTSPNFPSFVGESTNCTWILLGDNSDDKITLTFTHMDLGHDSADQNCQNAYVRILDGEDLEASELGRYCFGSAPPAITSRGNSLVVQLYTAPRKWMGLGFRATYEVSASACGGTLTSANGSFISPNYPNGYPPNIECIWNIQSSWGNRVQLSFRRIDIEQTDFCNGDYIEIHEDNAAGPLLGHFCGNEIPSNLTAARNLWISFKTDAEGNAPGFWADYSLMHGTELNASYGRIESPLYPLPNTVVGTFTWRVTVNESQVIQISFILFDFETYDYNYCSTYVKIFDGFDSEAPQLFLQCSGTHADAVISTGNVVYIEFKKTYYHAQFVLSWREMPPSNGLDANGFRTNITGCGGNVSLPDSNNTTLLSPGFPESYPTNAQCIWYITAPSHFKIQLKVESMEMEGHIICAYDRLEISDGVEGLPNYRLNSTLCNRDAEGQILISSGRTIKIEMLSDSSVSHRGFNLTLSTTCGGYLREQRGKITYPNHGIGNYGHAICEWLVIVRPGRTIQVSFESFDVYRAGEGPCGTDKLMMRNGGSVESPFLGVGIYCGSVAPAPQETNGNRLYVKFISYTSGGRGFSLIYSEKSEGCGGEIHLTTDVPSYQFSSPNYPNFPPPSTECEWIFTVPHGEAVQIHFEGEFQLQNSNGCIDEGVELRDGGTQLSPQIGLFCRNTMPSSQTSTGNIMYFRYYTNILVPRNGFKAEAKIASCGGNVVGYSGTVKSPGYPTAYEPNLNCMWTLKGPDSSSLIIEFRDLQISLLNDLNCTKDRIVITEQRIPDTLIPRNWTICGTSTLSVPNRIQTSTNQVQVKFITDGQRKTLKGFKLSFRASLERCGGTLRNPTGIIQSIGYPRPYPNSRYCYWTIYAPPDRRVRLEFLDFDLEERIRTSTDHFCVDSLTVYNGEWRDLNPLYNASLCGRSLPEPVETTSNIMKIIFRTDASDVHRGFKARYTTDLPILCGGIISGDSGVIMSPNSTTNTPNTTTSLYCNWKARGTPFDGTTIVSVNSVVIPPWGPTEPLCPHGSIQIYPGTYSAYRYRQLCGTLSNIKVYLPGTSFSVDYDAQFRESSFNLTYQFVNCGGKIYEESNLTSPNYPSAYNTSIECIWIADFGWGSQVKINFLDLDLDAHTSGNDGCDKDYVTVRNGRYPSSPVLGKYCGSYIPNSIISMSASVWIEFHSDSESNVGKRGFNIQIENVASQCGGYLHTKLGRIRSPSLPSTGLGSRRSQSNDRYPPNAECEWIIESVPGYTINVGFQGRFDMEVSNNCTNDYVQIFQKVNDNWISVNKYCGKQTPAIFNTTSFIIKVLFRSNAAIEGTGFTMYWFSPCGGVYNEPSGIVRSAHYDRFNHSRHVDFGNYWNWIGWESTWRVSQCNYVIQGNISDFIVVEFLPPFAISVPQLYGRQVEDVNANCPIVNTTIFEGNRTSRDTANYGGLYCGSELPPAFVGKGSVTISYNYKPVYHNFGFRAKYTKYQCGGEITEPRLISSPGHPFTSAPNMNCTWVVRAPPGKVVRFKFETLNLEFHSRCSFDFVRLFDGPIINEELLSGTYCGHLTEDFRRITSRLQTMTIQFVTDWSVQHSGFTAAIDFTLGEGQNCGGRWNISGSNSITIRSPVSNNGGKYFPYLDCQWQVTGADYQALEVTFTQFNLEGERTGAKNVSGAINEDEQCPYDFVEIRDGPGPYSQLLGKYCGTIIPAPVLSSQNFIWISFVSDSSNNFQGFSANIRNRPSPCGLKFVLNATNEVQYLQSPNYPQNYDNRVRCKWTVDGMRIYDEVDIQFIDLQIESSVGCVKDRLEIRDVTNSYTSPEGVSGPTLFVGNGATDWRFRYSDINTASIFQDMKYCGSEIPPEFFSVGRSAEIIFHTDLSGTATGFKLAYKAAGCNRTFENIQGRVFSPEWPAYAPLYTTCQYHIKAVNGSFITISFNTFVLSDSFDCSESAFEVRDGTAGGSAIARFCGSSRPPPIFSTSSDLYIIFRTRLQMSRGFDFTYTTTSAGRGCGGSIFHTGGSITSPPIPASNYSRDSDCRWRIRVPGNLKILIQFTSFVIGPDCLSDYVELLEMNSHEPSATPTLFTRFCPGDTPAVYTGNTDMAMIRYKTSVNNTGTGWRAEFRGIRPGVQSAVS